MNTNLLFFYKQLYGEKFRMTNKKIKKTLKKPVVFFIMMEFLDKETVYEVRYVCKTFAELLSKNMETDYKVLKVTSEKIRMKKRIESGYFDEIIEERRHILKHDKNERLILQISEGEIKDIIQQISELNLSKSKKVETEQKVEQKREHNGEQKVVDKSTLNRIQEMRYVKNRFVNSLKLSTEEKMEIKEILKSDELENPSPPKNCKNERLLSPPERKLLDFTNNLIEYTNRLSKYYYMPIPLTPRELCNNLQKIQKKTEEIISKGIAITSCKLEDFDYALVDFLINKKFIK